jgi:23S rRNA pseudouridine2605 synthase
MPSLRLQKYLSECGICSRRHAEEAIKNGEVIVNGKVAQIGQSVDPEIDKIEFSGKLVNRSE